MTDREPPSAPDVRRGGRPTGRRPPRRGAASAAPLAVELPVARVAVDVPLAHLDRLFDYEVPATMADQAVPGVRVRVRFAGQLVDGYLVERIQTSAHPGRLSRLERVVSAEPVLAPEIAALARTVADRYAGTMADVLRLAVPPRHARTEAEPAGESVPPPEPGRAEEPGPFADYPGGTEFLEALTAGRAPRAVWIAVPDTGLGGRDVPPPTGWPGMVARAVRATLLGGRGALVVVPDSRDLARVDTALCAALGEGRHVLLTAELGPADRYRRWLAVRRGLVRAVAGTRAAMFAPVADLGLVVLWDDGDDLHAEPHAPYPHAREVLALRAHAAGAAALIGGHACTAEGALLVESGWARPLAAARVTARARVPLVRTLGDERDLADDPAARAARLPRLAWRVARDALRHGPVLAQVPRRGYVPGLACERCREPARCAACHGPLALTSGHAMPHCGWCGRLAGGWRCAECGSERFRIRTAGARRTAEELGRAFPSIPVRTSGGDGVLSAVDGEPALVVATPGAEPVAAGGYAAALLLDGWALLARPDLRAAEETLRRWLNAAALVRPAVEGGAVVVLAEPSLPAVQALVRWDPAGHARRELEERRQLGYPPAARVASLEAPAPALRDLLEAATLPTAADVLGPVPVIGANRPATGQDATEPRYRALVRVPREHGRALADALRAAQGVRSARKAATHVRVRVDPVDLG